MNSKAAIIPAEIVVDEEENPLSEGEMDKYFFNEEEQTKRYGFSQWPKLI